MAASRRAILLLLLGAQMITAHGSYTFYSYLLPVPLAIAATVVLAVGVPLLEFAAVLIPGGRWGYPSAHTALGAFFLARERPPYAVVSIAGQRL
jgi:hypothetical protein